MQVNNYCLYGAAETTYINGGLGKVILPNVTATLSMQHLQVCPLWEDLNAATDSTIKVAHTIQSQYNPKLKKHLLDKKKK